MLGSRRNRPSLIGRAAHTAARTALIAGTATAGSGRHAASAPEAPSLTPETIAQRKQRGERCQQGIPTEEEFAARKARILA